MGHTPFNHLWMESSLILQFGSCELVYILKLEIYCASLRLPPQARRPLLPGEAIPMQTQPMAPGPPDTELWGALVLRIKEVGLSGTSCCGSTFLILSVNRQEPCNSHRGTVVAVCVPSTGKAGNKRAH